MSQAEGPKADDPAVWAAGTLRSFVSCSLPHVSHAGLSEPRISSSNSLRQSLHTYS
jgi:hypothetical protein